MIKKSAKIAITLALSGSVLMTAASAKAATVSFNVPDFNPGGGSVTGSFSYSDITIIPNVVLKNDVTAFTATFSGSTLIPAFSRSLTNLAALTFVPSGPLAGLFNFSTTVPDTSIIEVTSNGSSSVSAPSFAGPTIVVTTTSLSALSVPESSQVGGVCLVGLMGLGSLTKRKLFS